MLEQLIPNVMVKIPKLIQSILENKNSKNGIHATLILDMDDFSKTGKT